MVRSTGSGMGCPDWPKCFDQWVPPTDVAHLPGNYKEIYSSKRGKKIAKYIHLLESLGFTKKAEQIKNDKSLLIEEPFNAKKTWIEYINRVLGALTGLFSLLFAFSSLQFFKTNKKKMFTAIAGLILIGFNGWLGSVVVATNLLPGVVSVHFIFAFIAAAVIMIATHNGYEMLIEQRGTYFKKLLLVSAILTLVQIVLGTLIREDIDFLVKTNSNFKGASLNEELMHVVLTYHKVWSWLILGFGLFVFNEIRRKIGQSNLYRAQLIILFIWLSQFITGVVNLWFALPTFSQLIHIVLGSVLFGIQMYICIAFYNKKLCSDSGK